MVQEKGTAPNVIVRQKDHLHLVHSQDHLCFLLTQVVHLIRNRPVRQSRLVCLDLQVSQEHLLVLFRHLILHTLRHQDIQTLLHSQLILMPQAIQMLQSIHPHQVIHRLQVIHQHPNSQHLLDTLLLQTFLKPLHTPRALAIPHIQAHLHHHLLHLLPLDLQSPKLIPHPHHILQPLSDLQVPLPPSCRPRLPLATWANILPTGNGLNRIPAKP